MSQAQSGRHENDTRNQIWRHDAASRSDGNAFVGPAIKGSEIKAREDGPDADDVWRRIHDTAARLNPLFVGYSRARARFLRFFADGFSGAP